MRSLPFALVLALPLGALAQPTATFADSVLTVTGTDGDDFVTIECTAGNAQLSGAAIPGVACADVAEIDVDLMGGFDSMTFSDVADFALNPNRPSSYQAAGESNVDIDVSEHTDDLEAVITYQDGVSRVAGSATQHIARVEISEELKQFFLILIRSVHANMSIETGSGDDEFVVHTHHNDPVAVGDLRVFGGGGNDIATLSDVSTLIDFAFNGQEGDDTLISPQGATNGSGVVTLGWFPEGGTDRFTPGPGLDAVTIFGSGFAGGATALAIHEISGMLGPGCSFFDFEGGGGVLIEGDERVEGARYFFPAMHGGDVFAEADCLGIERDLSWGNSGPDVFHLQGAAGGGTHVMIDFPMGHMRVLDGFDGEDVSTWTPATSGTPNLLDGITYQDWPTDADPSTSGPSTVVISGKPDFPVAIDLGPDGGGTTRVGAVDTLWVDPLGLPFTDDGSQIVVDGGPPITYSGAEAVTVAPRTGGTASDDGPDPAAPLLTVAPNPVVLGGRARLAGAASGRVRVAVFDVLGREVAVLHDGPVGAQARTWPVEAGRLAAGLYVLRARGDTWAASTPLVVADR